MVEAVVTTGAISRAKLQSNHHYHQQTNIQFFNGPDEGKISHSTDLLTPSSPEGLPLLAPGCLEAGLLCLSSAL